MNRVTPGITQAQAEAVAELGKQWSEYKQRLNSVFTTELDSLNRVAVKNNIPVVTLQGHANSAPQLEEQP